MEPTTAFQILVIDDQGDPDNPVISPYIIRELGITDVERVNNTDFHPSDAAMQHEVVLIDARRQTRLGQVLTRWKKVAQHFERELLIILSDDYRSELDEKVATQKLTVLFTDTPRYVLQQQLRQMRAMHLLRQQRDDLCDQYKGSIRQASHEILETVNTIQGYSQRLLEQAGGVVPQHELVRLIRESDYLIDVSKTMLNFAYEQAEDLESSIQTVSIKELIKDVYESFHINDSIPTMSWEVTIDSGLDKPIYLDGAKLRQVLHNLVSNSIEHSGGTELNVLVQSGPNVQDPQNPEVKNAEALASIYIEVADNGKGLSDDLVQQINEGVIGKKVSDNKSYDRGNGLNVVQRLISSMKGTIEVQDNSPCGALFKLNIPYGKSVSDSCESLIFGKYVEKELDVEQWKAFFDLSPERIVKKIDQMDSAIREKVQTAIVLLDLDRLKELGEDQSIQSDASTLHLLRTAAIQQSYGWLIAIQERLLDRSMSRSKLEKSWVALGHKNGYSNGYKHY